MSQQLSDNSAAAATLRVFNPLANEPYSYNCSMQSNLLRTDNCSHPGATAEILGLILHHLDITFTQVQGSVAGSWMQGWEQLNRGEVDTVVAPWPFSTAICDDDELNKHPPPVACSESLPMGRVHVHALVGDKQQETAIALDWADLLRFLKPYTIECWILIANVVLLARLFGFLSTKRKDDHASVYYLGLFLGVFGNLYQGWLLATLLMNERRPAFANFAQFVSAVGENRLKLIHFENSKIKHEIHNSNAPAMQQLRLAVLANPAIAFEAFDNGE